jgi:hypothetical protein
MVIPSGKLRQSIILIVVITVVGALLSIYFFVYIDTKEEDINKRNFNALMKNAQNIRQKISEYATNKVTQNYLTYNLDYILRTHKNLREISDSLKRYLKYEMEVKDKHELMLDSFEKISVENKAAEKEIIAFKNGTIELSEQTLKFVFRDILTSCVGDTIDCSDCKCKNKEELKYFAKSTIPVSQFIEPLLSHDIFTEYVLLSPGNSKNESVIYESRSLSSVDSLKAVAKSASREVMLNGITYKIFRFPFTVDKYDWILIGLQDSESYLKESRSFDLFLLYTILLTALTLLLSLPLIKVVLISRNEKLNRPDVILCGASILAGCFFWTIIISQWDYDHLYKEDVQQKNILRELSNKIEAAFIAEIDSAYQEMQRAENVPIKHDMVSLRSSKKQHNTYEPKYKTFEIISWIDSSGMQVRKWATNYKATKKINISKRAYFKQIRESREWNWRVGQKIVIESIISWNNAEHLAVISKASTPKFPMIALTSPLRSVINCTLPQGYKFCIADQHGNVWFHSDPDKNLNENIFEECNITPTINNFLYNTGKTSTVVYENTKHHIDIKPLTDLPLYLITLNDLSVEHQSKVYVLQLTFVFLVIYIMIITLALITIGLTWKRSLKRHLTIRSLDWIKPDEDQIKLYFCIALLNLGIAVLLLLFAALLSPANEIMILLLTPLYVLPVYFLSLNNQDIHEFFNPLNRTLLSSITLIIIIFNISFFLKFEASLFILVYQLFVISLLLAWLFIARRLKEKYFIFRILKRLQVTTKFLKTVSLRTAYSLSFTSLCFILGIIPVFQFYRHAFNLERIKNAMAIQYNMLKQTSEKPKNSRRVYYIAGMEATACEKKDHSSPQNFRDFENLTKFVSPVIHNAGIGFIKRDDLFYTYVHDRRWSWSTDRQGHLCFAPDSSTDVNKSSLRSELQNYRSPQTLGWTAGILGIIGLFVISRYLTGRIFIFDVNRNLVEADLFIVRTESKKNAISDRELLQEPMLNNHLFIIGLPFSGERDYVDKLHPPEKHKRLMVDIIEVSNSDQWNSVVSEKATNEKYEIIIVDHFEYDFQNTVCNNSKLVLMEKLFLMWKKKIVILCTIHPSQFLECYGTDTKSKERWNTIFSHFYNIYYPLQKEKLSKNAIMKEYKIDEKKWQRNAHYYEFIERECSHGLFLQNLKPALYSLVDIANKNNLTIEELSDKVKSLSYTYYAAIWASCSKDERFLIYDLAEDGLVNVKNDESIIQLIYKGIFIQKRTLSIMNRSFRNFVLSYVNPTEVLEMRKETLSYGTWSRLKGPILFILIIAILFLLYTQKGFSDQIMAFLTSLAAGIPLILKLLALIESPAKSKEKGAG